ncbi:hypothetical protein CY34DRAFT_810955 [Suillus luteus UH-Slu-Lm8-n1]|uniref:Uncharacterized protein n=1 Tax=Suillus luteus UH-Slu-Lm8-n1 TaxID=930992 RepID=A0A0D0A5A5_9AGAM|nr:hypothetical protein CY34DRAFT_810955 [Suillus luteus UH-Slu-Lm8-n1]
MLINVTRKICMPSMMSRTHLYVHPIVGAWVVTRSLMEHLSAGSNEVVRVVLPVKGACRIIDHS